jgi:hypothetical protein
MLVRADTPVVLQERSLTPQAFGAKPSTGVSVTYITGNLDETSSRKRESSFGSKIAKAVRASGIVGWTKGWGKKN